MILHDPVIVGVCHTLIKTYMMFNTKSNPDINYGLQLMIIMY